VRAADDITIRAQASHDIVSVSAAAGLAADGVGAAGGVTVYLLWTDTLAYVEGGAGAGTVLDAGGDVAITAQGDLDATLIAGALAYGSSAGVGISSTVLLHNDVVRVLGREAAVTARARSA
jgi:hypothetical protein